MILKKSRQFSILLLAIFKYDKTILVKGVFEIIFRVIASFSMIYIPSLVIREIEEYTTVYDLIINLLVIFLIFAITIVFQKFLQKNNEWQYIGFRSDILMIDLFYKLMKIDIEDLETKEIQILIQNAMYSLSGNNWGIEGLLHNFIEISYGLLCIFLYCYLIGEISLFILVFLIIVSIIQVILRIFAGDYESHNRRKKSEIEINQKYINREAEKLSAGKDIRIYQMQHWLLKKYSKLNKEYNEIIVSESKVYCICDLLDLIVCIVRDLLCYCILLGKMGIGISISDFVLYIGIIGSFSTYTYSLVKEITECKNNWKLFEDYINCLDIDDVFSSDKGQKLQDDYFEIEFRNVSFSYSQDRVLDSINFRVKSGEKVALVGMNGAGKSTLVKLLCGFYKVESGEILINGNNINELNMKDYIKNIAVIFQDSDMFSFTIEENIKCNSDNQKWDECSYYLKKVGLWEKINSLPLKERTYINKDVDDGIVLSGGEKQKLLTARALYKNAKILVLDEPTAALDAIAESQLYQKYNELFDKKTMIFISHRLASTQFCDQIVYLQDGKIIEMGNHEQLLNLGGKYAEMFEVQSQYYRDEQYVEGKAQDDN